MDQPEPPHFDGPAFVRRAPTSPGVYRMYAGDGSILYVGKAKNLRNRLKSYFSSSGLAPKTRALVARIADIQLTLTKSETEALILEQTQIKEHRPPYNILLRDDKSYPYIYLASDKEFPSLQMRRVRNRGKDGQYFGPFPSALAVKESLNLLEKLFKVRQCSESYYRNRSRPCLQYQIKRCKAPCVGLVSREEYLQDVADVVLFLQGKSPELIRELIARMEQAAADLQFEKAAEYRDQIAHLRHVQESQAVESGTQDLDVIALQSGAGIIAFSMLYIRQGRLLGHKNFFQKESLEASSEEYLQAFLEQYYVDAHGGREVPPELVVSMALPAAEVLVEAVETTRSRSLRITQRTRGIRAQWLVLAQKNAQNALSSHLADRDTLQSRLSALAELLSLPALPNRIECFDISHSSGERTVASCVVFNQQGALKSDYRIYNIEGITPGDDYAAMRQVLLRRYSKLKNTPEKLPDLIVIDGGKGQLNMAFEVMDSLNLPTERLLGVAKGVTRKPGFETLLMPQAQDPDYAQAPGGETADPAKAPQLRIVNGSPDNPGLHLIQQIRDEAHRFAVTGHQQRRDKARRQSVLEQIEGVGPKRRRDLLSYFGSVQGMRQAPVDEIAKVKGISRALAEQIYLALNSDN